MKKTIIAAILGTTVALASASAMAVSSSESDSLIITLPVIDTNHTLEDQAGDTNNSGWAYTTVGGNKLTVTFNTYSAGSDKSYNFVLTSANGQVPITFHPHDNQIDIKTGDDSTCKANLTQPYPDPVQPGSQLITVGNLICK